jgi:hypothetical protein
MATTGHPPSNGMVFEKKIFIASYWACWVVARVVNENSMLKAPF